MTITRIQENNCPIVERTGDGRSVGRCWFYLKDKKTCPRHGDVSGARKKYIETGRLTDEDIHTGKAIKVTVNVGEKS